MSIELELRELFAADAAAAPSPAGLADGARRKVRHRVQVQRVAMLGVGVAAAAVAVAVPRLAHAPAGSSPPTPSRVAGSVPVGKAGQPLTGGASTHCVREYSPQAI